MPAILKIKRWNIGLEVLAIIIQATQVTREGFVYNFNDNNEIVNSIISTVQAPQPHRDLGGVLKTKHA